MATPPSEPSINRREFLSATLASSCLHWSRQFTYGQAPDGQPKKTEDPTPDERLTGEFVIQMAHCAAAAYESGEIADYADWSVTKANLQGEFSREAEHLRGYVATHGERVVVAFRGTVMTKTENWKTDFDKPTIPVEEDSTARVHQGFQKAYQVLKQDLEKLLTPELRQKPMVYTGHSLGGALAVLAASDLKFAQPATVITFGQPAVGNEAFNKAFPGKLYRFVNDDDIVPWLPTPPSYRYFPDPIWISEGRRLSKFDAGRRQVELVLKMTKVLKSFKAGDKSLTEVAKSGGGFLADAIENHLLNSKTGYLESLQKLSESHF